MTIGGEKSYREVEGDGKWEMSEGEVLDAFWLLWWLGDLLLASNEQMFPGREV